MIHTQIYLHTETYIETHELARPKLGGGVLTKRGQRWASKGSRKEALKGQKYVGPSLEHRVSCGQREGNSRHIGPRGGSQQLRQIVERSRRASQRRWQSVL